MSEAEVLQRATEVLGTEQASAWMSTPQLALGERKPIDVVRDGESERVLGVLAAIADGGYL